MGVNEGEMDPLWREQERSPAQQRIDQVEDEMARKIAEKLFSGFNSNPRAGITNAEYAAQAAELIDALVQYRIGQIIGDAVGIEPVVPPSDGPSQVE